MTSRGNEQALAARRRAVLKERQRAELQAVKERQRLQAQAVTAATAALAKVEAAEQAAAAAVAAAMTAFDSAQEVADMLDVPVKRLQSLLKLHAETNLVATDASEDAAGDSSPAAVPVSADQILPVQSDSGSSTLGFAAAGEVD